MGELVIEVGNMESGVGRVEGQKERTTSMMTAAGGVEGLVPECLRERYGATERKRRKGEGDGRTDVYSILDVSVFSLAWREE